MKFNFQFQLTFLGSCNNAITLTRVVVVFYGEVARFRESVLFAKITTGISISAAIL